MNQSQVPLVDICDDENINKDVRFLDAITKAFDENETSFFIPWSTKIKLAFVYARRSLQKRMKLKRGDVGQNETGTDAQESDDDRNMFDALLA